MPVDRLDLRRALTRLASGQQGYFTATQARELGYSYQAQSFHTRRGNWTRVDRALFRLPDWPGHDDEHLVRWALWAGGPAVVSHESALDLHGLGDVNPARVHLSVPPGFRRHADAVVLHRQVVPEQDTQDRGGYRVSSPARAIAECAADSLAQELLDDAVADALDQGVTSPRRLRDAASRLGPRAELGLERALATVNR